MGYSFADDIIKLNKREKKGGQRGTGRGGPAGARGRGRGRGAARGAVRGVGRGAGRGGVKAFRGRVAGKKVQGVSPLNRQVCQISI